jgi:hypothetical protein
MRENVTGRHQAGHTDTDTDPRHAFLLVRLKNSACKEKLY